MSLLPNLTVFYISANTTFVVFLLIYSQFQFDFECFYLGENTDMLFKGF